MPSPAPTGFDGASPLIEHSVFLSLRAQSPPLPEPPVSSTTLKRPAEREAELAAINRSQAIIEFSLSGTILFANENYLRTLGYAAEEVVGGHHAMFVPPAERDTAAYRAFWASLRDGEFRHGEFHRIRKDGTPIWLQATYNPILDPDGQPFKIIKIAADITPQVLARQSLAAVLNTVLDGVITIDQHGIIQSFNPAAVRMFGYPPRQIIGRNIKLLMPEPHRGGHDIFLDNYLRTGAAKVIGFTRELRAQRENGEIFPIELGVNEMPVVGKRMFVGTIRDITARKQAEAAVEASMAALSRSNQELDDFAYIASHDLKEPLRGLSHNARFLKEDFGAQLGEPGLRRLDRIFHLCERLERLVNDLLYFSRLGRQGLAIRQTDLNAVIADIESTMETTLAAANAHIVVPDRLPTIICDATRITEAFRNLITNAVKYNDKPEKRIEITCTGGAAGHVFHVRDNGIGIPPEFHQDVFRIFKRLNEEDETARGTGVGLTFVKKIIERQGGAIWIESEPGLGTTFHFTINTAAGD
jgi:PAS domain S-box-containing protein